MLASALRLANVTADVINIITGVLLVLSVVVKRPGVVAEEARQTRNGTKR